MGYVQDMTSATVPLAKPSPLPDGERHWLPGDTVVIRFRGVRDVAAAAGWTVRHETPYAYAWRVLQHQDADAHVFQVAQVGDHLEWDLLIVDGLGTTVDELDTTVTVLPR